MANGDIENGDMDQCLKRSKRLLPLDLAFAGTASANEQENLMKTSKAISPTTMFLIGATFACAAQAQNQLSPQYEPRPQYQSSPQPQSLHAYQRS
jgi:hypothetical protein